MKRVISVSTRSRVDLVDITSDINRAVKESGVDEGICLIYVPHTTAAVTVNEGADPNVVRDIMMEVNKVIPFSNGYSHTEGNSAAHIKSTIVGASESFIIESGRIVLGTWQSVFFCEFDGPRNRRVNVKIIKG
ncbi:MAG: secondary thiamine-phosphate synthase enzyme YjbQ [Fidelibacterota bacterium]